MAKTLYGWQAASAAPRVVRLLAEVPSLRPHVAFRISGRLQCHPCQFQKDASS